MDLQEQTENLRKRIEAFHEHIENKRLKFKELYPLQDTADYEFTTKLISPWTVREQMIQPLTRRLNYSKLSHRSRHFLKKNNLTLKTVSLTQKNSIPGQNGKDLSYTPETFLKGTQSSNPHNDYSQHFVDTGECPQNFIRDTDMHTRFGEYPKLNELIRLKALNNQLQAPPPMYLKINPFKEDLVSVLDNQFDCILIEPPLESSEGINWNDIRDLPIEDLSAARSFIWIWCGSDEGLDHARRCLKKWGFRRCEDICWIKTNKNRPGHKQLEPGAIFQRTKEHCLMGIKGTVRRSTDGDFIHANIDIDLLIEEEVSQDKLERTAYGACDKPVEIFHIIENFCLGKRKMHLFGRDSTLRPGWLTVGPELTASNFNSDLYKKQYSGNLSNGNLLMDSTDEIERLRPKSPPQSTGLLGNNNFIDQGNAKINGPPSRRFFNVPPAFPPTVNQQNKNASILQFIPGQFIKQGGVANPMTANNNMLGNNYLMPSSSLSTGRNHGHRDTEILSDTNVTNSIVGNIVVGRRQASFSQRNISNENVFNNCHTTRLTRGHYNKPFYSHHQSNHSQHQNSSLHRQNYR